jgi:hypothetical protein
VPGGRVGEYRSQRLTADEEAAGAGGEVESDVLKTRTSIGEEIGEIVHL